MGGGKKTTFFKFGNAHFRTYVRVVCGVGGHLGVVAFLNWWEMKVLSCAAEHKIPSLWTTHPHFLHLLWAGALFHTLSYLPKNGGNNVSFFHLNNVPSFFGIRLCLTKTFFRSWQLLLVPSEDAYWQMSIRVSVSHMHWRKLKEKTLDILFSLKKIKESLLVNWPASSL